VSKYNRFEDLPDSVQEDLLAWFNSSEPDDDDRQLLADLYNAEGFEAWNCVKCGDRVYKGDPKSWDHFQGVQQVDYTSYPGNTDKYKPEHLLRLCDSCRCHG
jgi:hypothetical protein